MPAGMGRRQRSRRIRESGNLDARHVPFALPRAAGPRSRRGRGGSSARTTPKDRSCSILRSVPGSRGRLSSIVSLSPCSSLAPRAHAGRRPPSPTGAAPARVSGTVVDPDGARVPRASARAGGGRQRRRRAPTAEANAEGEFRFDQVAPGRYELRVVADGFRADPLDGAWWPPARIAGRGARCTSARSSESVVVSAAQVELPLARAADSVTVVTSRDLRASQVETVADALRSVPGLTVSRNGGRGSVTSLFPRGGESDFTLVLVDGMKANSFGGGYDFSSMPAERRRADRGGARPAERALRRRRDGGGRAGRHAARRVARASKARSKAGASGRRASPSAPGAAAARGPGAHPASAWRATASRESRPPPANGCRTTTRWWATGRSRPAGTAAAAPTSARRRRFTSLDRGYPGPVRVEPDRRLHRGRSPVARRDDDDGSWARRWTQPFSAGGRRLRQTVSGSYLDLDSDFTSAYGLSASATQAGRPPVADRRPAVGPRRRCRPASSSSASRRRARSSRPTTAGPVPIRRWVAGLFAEARYQPSAPVTRDGRRARRADRARRARAEPRSLLAAAGVRHRHADVGEPARLRGVPARRRPRAAAFGWTRLHAAAGTGIRPPDALEIAFTDNPNLKPERSRSVEAGVDQACVRRTPGARRHRLLQPLRRPDRRGRPGACGRQPLPHRQHLERERRGASSCRRRADGAGG